MSNIKYIIKNFGGDKKNKVSMFLDKNRYGDNCIIKTGIFEKSVTQFVRNYLSNRKNVVCVDVGSNVGYYTVLMSFYCNKVYSFEPSVMYYNILQKNCKLNAIESKVELFNFALSDIKKDGYLCINSNSASFHTLRNRTFSSREKVNCFPLDSILNDVKIDLIKIDCDGHDPFVVKGYENMIKKFHPVIITEIAKEYYEIAGCNPIDYYNYLNKLGYRVYSEYDLSNVSSLETFIKNTGMKGRSSFNIICIAR